MDVKNFYLDTPLDQYECMRTKMDIITDKIIGWYGLRELETNLWVYI